ncbi:TrbI/VirB10 family protein [Acanthopleuribacter pedis]|uniref:TrbI/VirB10 family protein n=1 Tax=Acanthopleuribacter pedis TaxID=442870 RepID=A0A8J7QSH9_9BACT|nr:TrbI/VirB10 family protein [Acanthopleuribacter pedis]MBO1323395.1 TrbI/VirB10 family protein [Acanthopleuribacter pedis]
MLWLILLAGCTDSGIGPEEQKVVPNASPPIHLKPVPVEEQASTAELLQMRAIREQEETYLGLVEDPELVPPPEETPTSPTPTPPRQEQPPPADLRAMNPTRRAKTAREYRDALLNRPPTLKPLPNPTPGGFKPSEAKDEREQLNRRPGAGQKARRTAANHPSENTPKRSGGSRLFAPRVRASKETAAVGNIIPPGRFFRARLLGNVNVTLFSPVVFAEIYDPSGTSIGTAVGQATLHRYQKNRALIRFGQLHLHDGRTVNGDLQSFEMDLSLGLMGSVERRTFKRFAYSVAETFLATMSLEVDTGGDSFGSLFKFQLADRLLDQANERLRELDLDRQIHLQRDLTFWVASVRESSLAQNEYGPEIDQITTQAGHAFDAAARSKNYSAARRGEIESAYQRLTQRLRDLPAPHQNQ